MDILHLVDRLEEVFRKSKRIGNTRLVDERRVWPLFDRMRISIPEEVRRAERVTREQERTAAQAHEEAERVVSLARREAVQLIAEHSVSAAAHDQANSIRERAEEDSERIRKGANGYAFDVLCTLEQELRRALTVVENGIRSLQVDGGGGFGTAAGTGEQEGPPP